MRLSSCAGFRLLAVVCWLIGAASGCTSDDSQAVNDGGGMDGSAPDDAGGDSGGPPPDAGPPDDAAMDASVPDDAAHDAQTDAEADAGDDAMTPPSPYPMHLSETGLYQDGSLTELAEGVMPYAPRYELWSDGAAKQRWLFLPEGEMIDASDMDALVFPNGTKAWKEFSRDGKKLETRLLWKTQQGWIHVAYAWNEAQDDAVATIRGAQNVLGTEHDIPQRITCRSCHDGVEDTLLGVSAVQLAHSGSGLTLAQLWSDGWLSDEPPPGIERPDTLEWNALGYLHANCGTCHNPRGGDAFDRVDLDLWLRVGELGSVTGTQSYLTTVDVAAEQTLGDDTARVEPGMPENSALITRMKLRGDVQNQAMPPIASEITDDAGIGLVEDWIESLSP